MNLRRRRGFVVPRPMHAGPVHAGEVTAARQRHNQRQDACAEQAKLRARPRRTLIRGSIRAGHTIARALFEHYSTPTRSYCLRSADPTQRVTYANTAKDTPYGTVAISQFQALDRRKSAPVEASCRQ